MSQRHPNPSEELLPAHYDELLPISKLIHGERNPRRVEPTDALIESVAEDGIAHPLIVRPDSQRDLFHITDGWQRFQAATQAGWEALPVEIYDSATAALVNTEPEALGREWSRYDWARYCQSLAAELDIETDSSHAIAEAVSDHITRSKFAVQQYLEVLSLPNEIHPLLTDGPTGTDQQWAALQNYNPDVRQYSGLQWGVAQHIARGSDVSTDRKIGIAAFAVTLPDADSATEFVQLAVANPQTRLPELRKQVEFGTDHPQYLELPRAIRLSDSEKQAVMAHCRRTHQSLSEVIEASIKDIAATEGA
jgi:ParB/RepB/Spo0J family partition protein